METKNYFVRENQTDQQMFCQLQVSNKFRSTMDEQEAELLVWMVEHLVHRSTTEKEVAEVADRIYQRVCAMNACRSSAPYLVMSYSPLKADQSGFIRIERTSGRHQAVLLPIIDYRGSVNLQK